MNAKRKAAPRDAVVGGAAAVAAAIALAVSALISPWEGDGPKVGGMYVPYQDVIGVWTVCQGITGPAARPGSRYTKADCDGLLAQEVDKHYRGVTACMTRQVQPHEMAAILSWTYNVGVGNACRSTLIRFVNAGVAPHNWCKQLLRWDRAGGKRVRGLTNRRQAEYRICTNGAPLPSAKPAQASVVPAASTGSDGFFWMLLAVLFYLLWLREQRRHA